MNMRISLGWLLVVTILIIGVLLINARLEQTPSWGTPITTQIGD